MRIVVRRRRSGLSQPLFPVGVSVQHTEGRLVWCPLCVFGVLDGRDVDHFSEFLSLGNSIGAELCC
jgi:hypothetical protein